MLALAAPHLLSKVPEIQMNPTALKITVQMMRIWMTEMYLRAVVVSTRTVSSSFREYWMLYSSKVTPVLRENGGGKGALALSRTTTFFTTTLPHDQ